MVSEGKKRITVTLTEDTIEKITLTAKQLGFTRSNLLELVIKCIFESNSSDTAFLTFLNSVTDNLKEQ